MTKSALDWSLERWMDGHVHQCFFNNLNITKYYYYCYFKTITYY